MMMNRERWRMYKRIVLMFLLALIALTVLQRGNINMGNLELERETRMDASEDVEEALKEKLNLYHVTNDFWKGEKRQLIPKAQKTEHGSEKLENSGPRAWDVNITDCTINRNLTTQEWFLELEPNFQQFLLYRHCRQFPMVINHPTKCEGEIYMLIVIKSLATQHDRREAIRNTWGREQVFEGKKIKTLFLLGNPPNEEERVHHQRLVNYENQIYGDILQWDFHDSFFNLTLKETHFLKWYYLYCPNVRYIFKGDDDVYVSIRNLFDYLDIAKDSPDLFVGDVIFNAKPIRRKENKYYIPETMYNKTYYPPYAGGGGFIMDGLLAKRLHWVTSSLELYPIDDVFLGMCLELLDVIPIKHVAFKTFGLVKNKTSSMNKEPCFYKSMIVVHKLLPPDLLKMWNVLKSDMACWKKGIL